MHRRTQEKKHQKRHNSRRVESAMSGQGIERRGNNGFRKDPFILGRAAAPRVKSRYTGIDKGGIL